MGWDNGIITAAPADDWHEAPTLIACRACNRRNGECRCTGRELIAEMFAAFRRDVQAAIARGER